MPKLSKQQHRDPGCTACGKTKVFIEFDGGGGMCRECLAYFRDDNATSREVANLSTLQPKTKWKRGVRVDAEAPQGEG